MKLSLSKSLFTKTSLSKVQNGSYGIRLLYKLDSSNSEEDSVCSFRNYSDFTSKNLCSNFTVPSHLKFCGLLVISSSHFDPNDLGSLHIDLKQAGEFYLLVLETDSEDLFPLNESFKCYKVKLESRNQVNQPVQLEDIRWVEDDEVEFKGRNLALVNVSLLLFSKLKVTEEEPVELKTGLNSMESLPVEVGNSVLGALKDHLDHLKSEEGKCRVTVSEPFENVKDKLSEFYLPYTLGFGFESRGRRHALVVSGEYEESKVCLRMVVQSSVAVYLEYLESESLSRVVLESVHDQLLRLFTCLERDWNCVNCYVATERDSEDESFFKVELNEESKTTETKEQKVNKSTGKRTSTSKGKNLKSLNKNVQTNKKNAVEKKVFNFVPHLEAFGGDFSVKLDTNSGKLYLEVNRECKENVEESKVKSVNLVFKFLMESNDSGWSEDHVPFGGGTVPFFNFLWDKTCSLDDSLSCFNPQSKLKLVLNPYDLVDRTVLISPHRSGNLFPPWISPKKSTVHTVSGNYQYYHYTQGGVNDTGWGCCYRALQLVCSWYYLQYHTRKMVPSHSTIQKVLKENDLSHKDLKIGSSTWIGTVESGYFLNWYLDYNYKTLYLNTVSDFRNYNLVIADHFKNQGTPVMVGAGAYAYVILGICIEPEQGEVAYLISDPHYTGEDSVKNVLTKGGIGWKKVDFLSKAAEGKFINLCLPQLEKYGA